jgi:copper(I)-binding protein
MLTSRGRLSVQKKPAGGSNYAADIGAVRLGTRVPHGYKIAVSTRGEEDMTKSIWPALALAIAALGPAACGGSDAPVEADAAPAGIAVTNAQLMLPAVAGNPGAVYFDVANTSDRNMVIRAVSVAGAGSAAMHTANMDEMAQVMVPPGETVKFEPGKQHVMAMDLADTVTAGGKADVTVTFVGGDEIKVAADVHAAGDAR